MFCRVQHLQNMEMIAHEHSSQSNQQPAYDSQNSSLYERSRMSSYSFLKSPGEKNPEQPSIKQLVKNGTKGKFTSFYCKDLHVPWALWFHVVSLFSAQQFNLFSQSDKVSMPRHCSLILSEMHILLAFLDVLRVSALEWQCSECEITQLIIESDWCVPNQSTINVTKLYDKVDSVIYSDFWI
jgi:hypothetical protein